MNQGPWVQPQILAERCPLGLVLDTKAVHTWFSPRARAYLKKGSGLFTRHWMGTATWGRSWKGSAKQRVLP